MGFECIRFETGEGIARIFFNRPERLNAFNRQMLKELRTVLDQCAEDPQVRVILMPCVLKTVAFDLVKDWTTSYRYVDIFYEYQIL